MRERCSRGKRGDQWDALKAGAVVLKQAANLHASAALSAEAKIAKNLLLLAIFRFLYALCVFSREDTSADVSVWMWDCLWLDHRAMELGK